MRCDFCSMKFRCVIARALGFFKDAFRCERFCVIRLQSMISLFRFVVFPFFNHVFVENMVSSEGHRSSMEAFLHVS